MPRGPRPQTILFLPSAEACREPTAWRPKADLYRTRTGWIAKFDLAGVRLEDVRVEASGARLSVTGVRRDILQDAAASLYSMEIHYSSFERSIQFPCDLGEVRIDTEYRDGMLLIYVMCQEGS